MDHLTYKMETDAETQSFNCSTEMIIILFECCLTAGWERCQSVHYLQLDLNQWNKLYNVLFTGLQFYSVMELFTKTKQLPERPTNVKLSTLQKRSNTTEN